MPSQTILLTGAGGSALPFLINHLKNLGHRVLAADMSENAAGLYLADKGFLIPAGSSEDFYQKIVSICLEEKVSIVIPLVDEELIKCCTLEEQGISVILPQSHFVKLCLDKFALMEKLVASQISVPPTWLADDYFLHKAVDLPFPLIAKPRTGRGSRGISIINSQEELTIFLKSEKNLNQFIIQQLILGTEYTVSVTVWRDGDIIAVVPKKIIHKDKVTKMAVTTYSEKITSLCEKIQKIFSASGPFNVQLMIDANDNPYVFEINPRFSTSITLTIAAGIDEISLIIDKIERGHGYSKKIWRSDVTLIRTTSDLFVDKHSFTKMHANIKRNNEAGNL